ncbi:hypothetical protein JHK85_010435 [Glycine max]|nr:hypothetical protein JHK85_010435 [Glycine max]
MSNLCPCYKSFSILLRVCRGDFPRLCHGDHSQLLIDNPVKALIYRGDTTNWLWGQSLAGTYHGQVGGENLKTHKTKHQGSICPSLPDGRGDNESDVHRGSWVGQEAMIRVKIESLGWGCSCGNQVSKKKGSKRYSMSLIIWNRVNLCERAYYCIGSLEELPEMAVECCRTKMKRQKRRESLALHELPDSKEL